MKTDARILDVTSTLEGEKVKMGIDVESFGHIMSILTDLYSDPELAILREYATNALDAHVEAGVTRPIEITLPSNLSPFLKIRDYGEGLDADGIRDIYSKYGSSTKRSSNEVVGMLGLGCKSALTYADQFTLTGIKDGFAIQVSISRDEDGSGSMTIVNEYETPDDSGVEIVIPVKGQNYLRNKAADFFRFWEDGKVLVNGEEPVKIGGMKIADDLLLTTEVDEDMVVMGNVAYPMPDSAYGNYHTVAYVDIGTVNFTPSRESLMMTTKTKAALAVIRDRVKKEKQAALVKLIDEAPNKWEAIVVATEAQNMGLDRKSATYKGELIPQVHGEYPPNRNDRGVPIVTVNGNDGYSYRRRKGWEKGYTVDVTKQNVLWFTGYESDAFTPHKRAKLDQWFQKQIAAGKFTGQPLAYLFTEAIEHISWIDPARVFTWEEVNAEKIVRADVPRRDGRPTGAYEGWVAGSSENVIEAGDIDTTAPLYWYDKNGYGVDRWSSKPNGLDIVQAEEPNATIILLGANRVAKFQRDFPNAKKVNIRARELCEDWIKSVTKDEKLWLSMKNNSQCGTLTKLNEPEVLDPELRKAIQACTTKNDKLLEKYTRYTRFSNAADVLKLEKVDPLAAYPLLTSLSIYGTMSGEIKNHMTIYVNAVYTDKLNKEVSHAV